MSNLENNKLIAEFMDYEFLNGDFKIPHSNKTTNSDFREWCFTYWDDNLDSGGYLVCPGNLMYHSDWNWLMEVVKRITTLEEFQYYDGNSLFWDEFCSLDIDSVYSQCVEFIKWYNN